MADNYIGNRMDDYRAGRLNSGARQRKLTPSGRRPGEISLPAAAIDFRVWIPQGAMLPAGLRLIEVLRDSGIGVSYCAQGTAEGAKPAMKFGARHYPPEVAEPTYDAIVEITPQEIRIDGGRVIIGFESADSASAAAEIATTFFTKAGLKASSARIEI